MGDIYACNPQSPYKDLSQKPTTSLQPTTQVFIVILLLL